MASPFQKYQGEQVQQIPSGYIEAMGSMGKAYQQIGASIAGGIMEADKRATEEAKLRGALAPYLKNDPRNQTVEGMIRSGTLVKNEDGTVAVNPIYEGVWDATKAKPVIDFYNQTGGDGSKLGGRDLMAFASEFESQKKYEADIAGRDRAKLETEKARAELDKLKADTAATYAKAYGTQGLAALGRGEDVTQMPGFSISGAAHASGPAISPTSSFSIPTYNQPTGVSPATTGALNYTPVPTPKAPAPVSAPAPAPVAPVAPVTAKPVTAADVITPTNVDPLIRIQAETNDQLSSIDTKLAKDIAFEQANLGALLGKPGVDADAAIKLSKARVDTKASIAAADKEVLNRRLTGAQEEYKLKTQAAEEARKVEAGRVGAIETRIKYGETAGAAPVNMEAPKTFAEKQQRDLDEAVPTGIGGTAKREARDKAYKAQQEVLEAHPAVWSLGLFSPGAKEYMVDLKDRPSSAPVPGVIRNALQENMTGYAETQSFLTGMKKLVESTDDNGFKNYLNRWQALTSDDAAYIEGEMSSQFGVAAFRRPITAGGNFSDADREFVKSIIADLNTKIPTKTKDYIEKQVEVLARFMDAKFRSGFKASNMTLDLPTAKKYLQREIERDPSKTVELSKLTESEQYYRDFGLVIPGTSVKASRTAGADVESLRTSLSALDKQGLGNSQRAKDLRSEIEKLTPKK
jgi:chaperonin cofactor prefoldin